MSMKITEKIREDEILNKILSTVNNEIYLVGGSVRDYLMDIKSHDRDLIVADEDAKTFSLKLTEILDATFVSLDEDNKIYRLIMPNKIDYLDITNPIENSLEKDLMRRDLTINSIAINLKTGNIIDITGGISDIKNKLINLISDENFIDDPLRMLRAYRFQAVYGFDISIETTKSIIAHASLISKPSVERVNYEILKLFSGKYTTKALESMNISGILEILFPFVKELKKVPPNSHHHLDLFHHSLETVNQIQKLYESSEEEIKKHLETMDFGGHTRLAHLKLAGFMHDIGKFSTWTIEDSGRHRFIKHDDVGAKLSEEYLKKLHFSNKQIEYISQIIKFHIYPSGVMSAPEVSEKTMMRYLRKMENNALDEIILAKADRLSARGPEITDEIVQNNINSLTRLCDFCIKAQKTMEPLPKLLSGEDVMKILNIKPSKKLGIIMSSLYEAQLSGDITTKKHAIEFVKSIKL